MSTDTGSCSSSSDSRRRRRGRRCDVESNSSSGVSDVNAAVVENGGTAESRRTSSHAEADVDGPVMNKDAEIGHGGTLRSKLSADYNEFGFLFLPGGAAASRAQWQPGGEDDEEDDDDNDASSVFRRRKRHVKSSRRRSRWESGNNKKVVGEESAGFWSEMRQGWGDEFLSPSSSDSTSMTTDLSSSEEDIKVGRYYNRRRHSGRNAMHRAEMLSLGEIEGLHRFMLRKWRLATRRSEKRNRVECSGGHKRRRRLQETPHSSSDNDLSGPENIADHDDDDQPPTTTSRRRRRRRHRPLEHGDGGVDNDDDVDDSGDGHIDDATTIAKEENGAVVDVGKNVVFVQSVIDVTLASPILAQIPQHILDRADNNDNDDGDQLCVENMKYGQVMDWLTDLLRVEGCSDTQIQFFLNYFLRLKFGQTCGATSDTVDKKHDDVSGHESVDRISRRRRNAEGEGYPEEVPVPRNPIDRFHFVVYMKLLVVLFLFDCPRELFCLLFIILILHVHGLFDRVIRRWQRLGVAATERRTLDQALGELRERRIVALAAAETLASASNGAPTATDTATNGTSVNDTDKTLVTEVNETDKTLATEVNDTDKTLVTEVNETDKTLATEVNDTDKTLVTEVNETDKTLVTEVNDTDKTLTEDTDKSPVNVSNDTEDSAASACEYSSPVNDADTSNNPTDVGDVEPVTDVSQVGSVGVVTVDDTTDGQPSQFQRVVYQLVVMFFGTLVPSWAPDTRYLQ